jgi:hypothetical protein
MPGAHETRSNVATAEVGLATKLEQHTLVFKDT